MWLLVLGYTNNNNQFCFMPWISMIQVNLYLMLPRCALFGKPEIM